MRTCELTWCSRKHWARGLCRPHYQRRRDGRDLRPPIRDYDPGPRAPVGERIGEKTDRSGGPDACWPFSGGDSRCRSGHRQVWHDGRMDQVHRAVWELEHGQIPDGMVVRHRCDNPSCVNPAHLELGSVADNNRDRDERGRHIPLPGMKNGNAKLTREEAVEIRRLAGEGRISQKRIAQMFGTSQGNVSLIHRGKAWSHV